MTTTRDIGALILGGGNASRMGFPKAFLPLEGQTMCEIHNVDNPAVDKSLIHNMITALKPDSAETPQEIAISILAKLIQVKSKVKT